MNVKFDCALCTLNGVLNLFKKELIDEKYQTEIFKKILEYFSGINFDRRSTANMREVKRIIKEVSGISDPFKPLKEQMTKKAIEYYNKFEKDVKIERNLDKAMRLAIAGNIIDFGPGHNFDVDAKIQEVLSTEFPIDNSKELFREIQNAKSILYIGDNTGEIVFDKLFLETINHPNVTFVVRHKPILNDSTIEDAKYIGLEKIVKEIITTGDEAPGVILDNVSEEFMQHFNSADLIISKGQGNFEGLDHITDKNIFFLFTVKCKLISEAIKVPVGKCVVKSAMK